MRAFTHHSRFHFRARARAQSTRFTAGAADFGHVRAIAADTQSTFASRFAGLVRSELVGPAFLVRRLPTEARDFAPFIGCHRSKSSSTFSFRRHRNALQVLPISFARTVPDAADKFLA
jgi:hypothetical protein